MPKPKNISILGLGWLGLPLAKILHQNGYNVRGSVSSLDKRDQLRGLPFDVTRIILKKNEIQGDWDAFLHQAEVLIINIPPGRMDGAEKAYPALMDQIIQHSSSALKVVFTSTTGVYAEEGKQVNEKTKPKPGKASGKAVLSAEQRLAAHFEGNLTILRLAGLIGEDRHPGRFLAAKKALRNGEAPVNLVHQQDCIGIIQKVIENNAWGKIINVCAGQHPIRRDYYQKAASALGLDLPEFGDSGTTYFKIVDNAYGKELLNYEYQFDNPEEVFTAKRS